MIIKNIVEFFNKITEQAAGKENNSTSNLP
jgi:hypothetical protein